MFGEALPHYLTNIMTTSSLGEWESQTLNKACSLEAMETINLVFVKLQVVVSMVIVRLLEPNPIDASREGLVHTSERCYDTSSDKLIQSEDGYVVSQVARSNNLENWEPKDTIGITRELGDCLRVGANLTYGNGVFILKEDRKDYLKKTRGCNGFRCYSTSSREHERERPRKFEKLVTFCQSHPDIVVTDGIYQLMYSTRMYEIAYHKLKSNPGNMTPGINPTTLDGISLEWVEETIARMKDGSFKFAPGRRIQIPKPNGSTRPLTIAPPRDKIVQEVMRMILEAIFEPTFSENSHGFRPGRSCHTALRQVRTQFGAAISVLYRRRHIQMF